jgi:LuxR family transcriptional regulator, maltose regulon positive regulatory protein
LTAAELRLLPILATHLSGPEIAAELFLSPHTVKSHQVSLYRKLGISSRSQTVARARELALFFIRVWVRCGASDVKSASELGQ